MEVGVETWIAFAFTLMVYCYLGKDIPFLHFFYRVAVYVFVGVALGYGAVIAWHSVLSPRLLLQLQDGKWWYLVPLVFCLLLLSRVRRSWRGLGNITIAFLFGVGAALAVGGGLVGTLIPQTLATFVSLNPAHYEVRAAAEGRVLAFYVLEALFVVVGTISSLLYFHFTKSGETRRGARLRNQVVNLSAGVGKVFIMFTLGALFAATGISRISLLVDRVRFIVELVWSLVPAL